MQRDTVADQLIKVIQVLELGRKTGTLSVERGSDSMYEEGLLVFVNGRIVEAKTSFQHGPDALASLQTWEQCRFAFLPGEYPTLPSRQDFNNASSSSPAYSDERWTKPLPIPEQVSSQPRVEPVPVTPRQTRPVETAFSLIESAGLARVHKHLFLLLDGHRTLAELTQLTRRSPDELMVFLRNLKRLGLIQF
jgi:hypothetical protein